MAGELGEDVVARDPDGHGASIEKNVRRYREGSLRCGQCRASLGTELAAEPQSEG